MSKRDSRGNREMKVGALLSRLCVAEKVGQIQNKGFLRYPKMTNRG